MSLLKSQVVATLARAWETIGSEPVSHGLATVATVRILENQVSVRKYHNHFFCAIRNKPKKRGFGLVACGAPEGSTHWVRFEDFRVSKL